MLCLKTHLIWIDLEMTGLDPKRERIIEIATVVTDKHLNILEEGPVFAIQQSDGLLSQMDQWNTRQHHQSGLVERVKNSSVTEAEAERKTLAFLKRYSNKGKSPMCGNSVHMDRFFLKHYMPTLEAFFHYRNIDVSTVKELARRWRSTLKAHSNKDSEHLALQDIRDSIDELKYYREHFIRCDDTKSTE